MKASKVYKEQAVNNISQTWSGDDVTIKIYKRGWKKSYTFKAHKLGTPEERIDDDEEVKEKGVK